jgi:hypothetical protein
VAGPVLFSPSSPENLFRVALSAGLMRAVQAAEQS